MKKLYLIASAVLVAIFSLLGVLLYGGYLDVKNFYLNLLLFPGTIAAAFLPGLHSDFFIVMRLIYNAGIYFGFFILTMKAFRKSKL